MATSKQKKPRASAVEDIEHVDVPGANLAPVVQQPQEAVVVEADEDPAKTLELTIQREIRRFGIADAGIEELKKKYGELTIVDVNDKVGYEAAKKAWNEVRGVRTGLEKKGLEIRGSYTKVTKAVSGEEDRLVGLVKPLEDDLYKKWKKVDDEKEAEKLRKAAEAEKLLRDRVDELLAVGCKFEGGYYGIGGTIAIDVATLRAMPAEDYDKLKAAVVAKAAEIKLEEDRLAEEKRLADEKFAADQKKLKDQQDELAKQQQKLLDDQAELARLKKEAADQKREMRMDRLGALGMTPTVHRTVGYDNGWARYELKLEEIGGATDEEFKVLLATAKDRVDECKKKLADHEAEVAEERKVLEEKKVNINEVMTDAGLTYRYGTEDFFFKNDFVEIRKGMNELIPLKEAELEALYAEVTGQITAAKTQQLNKDQAAKDRAEKERRSLLGDQVNFTEYINEVLKVAMPEMQSEAYQAKMKSFFDRLDALAKEYLPEEEVVTP